MPDDLFLRELDKIASTWHHIEAADLPEKDY